jgi:hypothetical protein
MSKVSEHLHALHKAMHQDRTDAIANCNAGLEKASSMEPAGGPHTTFLKAEIARHTKALAHHSAGMEECSKATEGDLNKLVPTRVVGVVPSRPTAVPRHGQPEVKNVPSPEFAKLLGTDPSSWHEEETSLQ